MKTVNTHEAKTQLSRLLRRVAAGEEITIANRGVPVARLALFYDVGRAAARERLSLARPLMGAGLGASFLDGLMRIDLARALRAPTGWRLDFYVDGVL